MNIVVIIQARMGSTRLPGKVLKILGNRTVLANVINRVKQAKQIDQIIVATTSLSEDDEIVRESERHDVEVFRGSSHDVLSRYYFAAKKFMSDVIVRVTADCPLYDGFLLDRMLIHYKHLMDNNIKIDLLSNTAVRTFPRGLDTTIFSFDVLARTFREAKAERMREHVVSYIYENNLTLFNVLNYREDKDYSFYRWTLDTREDYEFLTAVYNELDGETRMFVTQDVISLLEKKPELAQINAHIIQKA